MKGIKGMSKRSGLLAKGTKALLLLLLLVLHTGCPEWWPSNANRGEAYQLAIKTSVEDFPKALEEKLQDYKNHPEAVQKTLEETLYSLVKNKEYKKLSIFLTRCKQVLGKLFSAILNAINPKTGMTPLGAAIRKHDGYVFDSLLLQIELDFNKVGKNLTSLVLALIEKQFTMVQTLLNKQGIDIQTIDPSSGNTTLHLAINNTNAWLENNRKNWLKIVDILISRLEKEALNLLSAQNNNGDTPLHLAIKNTIEPVALSLVDKLLPQHLAIQNNNGDTPLHLAIKNKIEPVALSLVDKLLPQHLAIQNNNEDTPLHLAINKSLKEEIVASLINKLPKEALGVQNNKSQRPLESAIELKNEPIALLLIDALPEEGLRVKNKELVTPIYSAIKYNLNRTVEKLVGKLSAINDFYVTDQKGKGLLHIASRNNNYDAFKQIFTKISTLSNIEDTVTRLFHKDRNGYTVFASSYLSKNKIESSYISDDNCKMFQNVLLIVKDNLNGNQWQDITNEINALKNNKTINVKHADRLHAIVTTSMPTAAAA